MEGSLELPRPLRSSGLCLITCCANLMQPEVGWSDEAEQLLREVPFFVRPAVRRRIVSLALEAGRDAVDADFYRQARDSFGRKQGGR